MIASNIIYKIWTGPYRHLRWKILYYTHFNVFIFKIYSISFFYFSNKASYVFLLFPLLDKLERYYSKKNQIRFKKIIKKYSGNFLACGWVNASCYNILILLLLAGFERDLKKMKRNWRICQYKLVLPMSTKFLPLAL